MAQILENPEIPLESLVDLYNSVGWIEYTKSETVGHLPRALKNSSIVVAAFNDSALIGLARGLSDDVSIFFLQDILVHPHYQRVGIGSQMLERCLLRYHHVRMHVLITNNLESQRAFYAAHGFQSSQAIGNPPLECYVRLH